MLLSGDMPIWARAIIIAIAIPGVILFLLGIQRIFRHKVLSGIIEGIAGSLLLLIAGFTAMLSVNLNSYDRTINEQIAVKVWFREANIASEGMAKVYFQKDDISVFDRPLEAWQLDIRILEWRGLPALIGINNLCRLQRFSNCYWDANFNKYAVPYSTYNSPKGEEGLDLWTIAKKHPRWIPWVKATYGSTEFMPTVKGAFYDITLDSTGLLVHPSNEIAHKAVAQMTSGRELYFTIARIRRRQGWIKDSLPSLRENPLSFFSDLLLREGQGKTYWNYKKEIEMISIEFSGETKRIIQAYYYCDGVLIFVDEEYRPYVSADRGKEISKESTSREESQIEGNHYYFDNRKIIKWINNGEKEVDIKSQNFWEAESKILKLSDELLSKSKPYPFW